MQLNWLVMNCKTASNILLRGCFPCYASYENFIPWNAIQSIWYLPINLTLKGRFLNS